MLNAFILQSEKPFTSCLGLKKICSMPTVWALFLTRDTYEYIWVEIPSLEVIPVHFA